MDEFNTLCNNIAINWVRKRSSLYHVACGYWDNPLQLPGIGTLESSDFILKTYLYVAWTNRNHAMQELYVHDRVFRRTMFDEEDPEYSNTDESGWTNFVEVTGGGGSVAELQTEVESLKTEIQELKQSFAASINSIGDGLKITDGVLSVDCASVSDTENAVNEIIK